MIDDGALHGAFRELLRHFHRTGHNEWIRLTRSEQQVYTRKIREALGCGLIKETELSPALGQLKGGFEDKLIFLRCNKHGLSLLDIEWDFSGRNSTCQLKLWILYETNAPAEKWKCIGYRFEPPHKRGEDHNYWHVQLTLKSGKDDERLVPTAHLGGISDSWPAFPVAAWNPLSLVACAWHSVRGYRERATLKRVVRESGYRNVQDVDIFAVGDCMQAWGR